jgi:tRNA1(Val) A37 N6-methylase TrmN6
VAEDTLYIHQAGGDYSDDYRRLTGEFYLKF